MKKNLVLILILFSIIASAMLFSACDKNNNDQIYEEKIYPINSVEDFEAIRDKLGYKYQNAIFSINTNLDLSANNWDGFGKSPNKEDAFSGTILGNGNTIKYKVNIAPKEGRGADPSLREEYGLVKYGNDAHFQDLKVEYRINVPNEAEKIYIGGICAHLYGNSSVKNVTVNGEIVTTLRDFRKDKVHSDGSVSVPETAGAENNKFFDANIGGVLGYAKGTITLNNIVSNVDITVNRNRYCLLDNLNLGGIAGLLRPVDLSKANGNILRHKELQYGGDILFDAGNAYVGGIVGALHHSVVDNVLIGDASSTNFKGNASGRLSLGSVAGILENSVLRNAVATVEKMVCAATDSGKKVSFNIGGIAGLLKNTSISYCDADSIIEIKSGTYFYAGGLTGVCYDSQITKSVSSGGITVLSSGQVNAKNILDFNFVYTHNNQKIQEYYQNSRNGGIAGRMEGQSTLGEVATKFQAYQPIVGEVEARIEIVVLKKGKLELDKWIEKSRYQKELMHIAETQGKDIKEDEQQYTISHFHQIIEAEKVSYQKENAKVCIDRDLWEANNKSYDLEIGTSKDDDAVYLALKAEIAGPN